MLPGGRTLTISFRTRTSSVVVIDAPGVISIGASLSAANGPPARASVKKSERARTTAPALSEAGNSLFETAIAVSIASVPKIRCGRMSSALLVACVNTGALVARS